MPEGCKTPFRKPLDIEEGLININESILSMNELMSSMVNMQGSSIELLSMLVQASRRDLLARKYDTGIQTIETAVTTVIPAEDSRYTQHSVYEEMTRTAPVLYLINLGPGNMYIRTSGNGEDFSSIEYAVFEGGVTSFYDVYEARVRSPVAGTKYILTEHYSSLGNTYSTLNRPVEPDALTVVATYGGGTYPGDILQAGGANSTISFDITGFANIAKLTQATITQLAVGASNYTLEIWERRTYNPAARADLYLRTWSRDYNVSEDSDIIDPITLYFDRDSNAELHVRIVNNAGGTASEFAVSFKAFVNPA